MVVIGLTGKAGAGKDSVADRLVEAYNFRKISLAAPLKRCVADIFQISAERMTDRVLREQELPLWPGWTPRRLLQFVGTELFRERLGPDIWVRSLVQRIRGSPTEFNRWVVTDVRFDNEDACLRQAFPGSYWLWDIIRPGHEGAPSGIPGHASEAGLSVPADLIVMNTGSFHDLRCGVDAGVQDVLR